MKKIAIVLFILLFPCVSFAQDSKPVPRDVFEFAPDVQITEPVSRDLIAVGGKVNIAQKVDQDVFVAGGNISITADVEGDVRAIGTHLIIDSNIGGNLAVLAQSVEIKENAVISGSVRIKAENVIINGEILSDAVIDAINLEQNGIIGGALEYKKIEQRKVPKTSFSWFFRLIGLFGMLVVGLILISIWPKAVKSAISLSIKNPIKDFLFGAVALISTPIVVIVLLLTLIGFPLGLILLAIYLIALYFAQIFVGVILGTYIFGAIKGSKQAEKTSLLLIMITGVVVLWLIVGIPGIGWLLKLIASIWGLGILINMKIKAFKKLEH